MKGVRAWDAVSHRPFRKAADVWSNVPLEARDEIGSTPASPTWASLALGLGLLAASGCTRTYYHDFADRDVYGILKERLFDWRWRLPPGRSRPIPKSRMADPPIPTTSRSRPTSRPRATSRSRTGSPSSTTAGRSGERPRSSTSTGRSNIPAESDGKVLLEPRSIMRLAIDQQPGLPVQLRGPVPGCARPHAGPVPVHGPGLQQLGHVLPEPGLRQAQHRTSSSSARLNGFNLELMTGAQMLVSLANSLVFEYSGKGFQVASPNLLVNFTQPLLRGAWARIVTQELSLQERGVLYALRNFAHFRRTFYVGLVAKQRLPRAADPAPEHPQPGAEPQVVRPQPSAVRGRAPGRVQDGPRARSDRRRLPGAQVDLLGAEAELQTQLDPSRSSSACRPRWRCGSTTRSSSNSSSTTRSWTPSATENDELHLGLLQADEIPRAELTATAAGSSRRRYDELKQSQVQVEGAATVAGPARGRAEAGLLRPRRGPGPGYYERKADLARKIEEVLDEWDESVKDNRGQADVVTCSRSTSHAPGRCGQDDPRPGQQGVPVAAFRGLRRPDPDPRLPDRADSR